TNETAWTEASARVARGRSRGSLSSDGASRPDAGHSDARSRAGGLRSRRVPRAAEAFRALEDLRSRTGADRRPGAGDEGWQPLRRDGQTPEQLYRVQTREAGVPEPSGSVLHRGRPRARLSRPRGELGGSGRYVR